MERDTRLSGLDGRQTGPVNRPGLPVLAYRIGTRTTFSERMLARLRTLSVTHALGQTTRPLAALTTRDADDPAVALVDAWAAVADVITFYQERIANEGFLRTATERRSVLELARAVGYELSPGLAASVFLTFLVEDAPGAPPVVNVPKGTKVQSIPGQDELPQTFETMEAIEARGEWNALRLAVPANPQPSPPAPLPQTITPATTELWLRGTSTRLQPGDPLLIGFSQSAGADRWCLVTLRSIDPDTARNATRVSWGGPLAEQPSARVAGKQPLPAAPRVFAMRQQAGLFGNLAPDPTVLPEAQKNALTAALARPVSGAAIELDATYAGALPKSLVVLVAKGSILSFTIERASTLGRADFMLSAKVTRLELDAEIDAAASLDRRSTVVLLQSEALPILPEIPASSSEQGATQAPARTETLATELTVDRIVAGLRSGQPVIVSGETLAGRTANELVVLSGTTDNDGTTTLHFRPPLQETYRAETVRIAANGVRATHGETIADEVLGSGDGRLANQRFRLRRAPLTYVAAPVAGGAKSTLEVRVNGLLWQEAPSLFGLTSRSTAYTVRRENNGDTCVIFGDGHTGARLPSGQENVTATYRCGMGADGNVAPEALSLLQTRPLGIRGVTNALAARGGTPPETLESARDRAPRTVLTLGRVVSQTDFEELALSFAGIGKAQSVLLWTGEARLLHLTVADILGRGVDPASDLHRALVASVRTLGNGLHAFRIDAFTARFFEVGARLWIDPRFRQESVVAAVRDALAEAFRFERRAFGQGVAASEVVAVMQGVDGVVAVDLDRLRDTGDPDRRALGKLLPARTAFVDFSAPEPRIAPAELLLIDADALDLSAAPAREPVS